MPDQTVHPDAGRWGGWAWRDPRAGEHFRRCGFCGSIHPEDLAAEPNWRADWADMKYGWPHKFYVDIPNRTPERLYVIGATSSLSNTDNDRYVARTELTDEQREIVKRDGWDHEDRQQPWEYFEFGTHPTHFGKFYTLHLRDADLSADVKATIEQHSGLTFEFRSDGRVAWHPTNQVTDVSPG